MGSIITLLCFPCSITLLNQLCKQFIIILPFKDEEQQTLLQILVLQITSLGLLLSWVLNGYGTVSYPHTCIIGIYYKNYNIDDNIRKLEYDMDHVCNLLAEKQYELQNKDNESQQNKDSSSSLFNFFKKLNNSTTNHLQKEIN